MRLTLSAYWYAVGMKRFTFPMTRFNRVLFGFKLRNVVSQVTTGLTARYMGCLQAENVRGTQRGLSGSPLMQCPLV